MQHELLTTRWMSVLRDYFTRPIVANIPAAMFRCSALVQHMEMCVHLCVHQWPVPFSLLVWGLKAYTHIHAYNTCNRCVQLPLRFRLQLISFFGLDGISSLSIILS